MFTLVRAQAQQFTCRASKAALRPWALARFPDVYLLRRSCRCCLCHSPPSQPHLLFRASGSCSPCSTAPSAAAS